jgi:hypothetical protein
MRYLIALVLLVGCTPIEVRPDAGRSFGIEHSALTFSIAMDAARQHCERMGLLAKHTFTDRASVLAGHSKAERVSWFECVEG